MYQSIMFHDIWIYGKACGLKSIAEYTSELIGAEWLIFASVNLAIIGSDNGLSPIRHQAIIWSNAG